VAKQFVEIGPADKLGPAGPAKQDGAALTLTAGKCVRVLYDDTMTRRQLAACMDKAKMSILRFER
jgi:hypothetical protein